MPTNTVTISADSLRPFAAALFQAAGISAAESKIVADSLVESNLCGHESHGVVRVREYLDFLARGAVRANVELQVLSQTASLVVCDGQLGFGQIQMHRLIELLQPMAREQGLACGTIRRCGHVGRLGEWVERLAQNKLAGLMSVNDNGVLMCVAPPGGKQARISTNPLAIGVPTNAEPLVLDISTSMVANGKIRVAQIAGQTCPDGWLLDANGQPTNDPSTRFADPPGTILPMGGYKGFGLGLMLDILTGGLSGGFCPPAPAGEFECNNVLLIAFDPARFDGLNHFISQSQGLSDFVRETPPAEDSNPIRLPNDRSRQTRQTRLAHGIPLDEGTWSQLVALADRLEISVPTMTIAQ
ncbi:MAG: Ldh family oxidoreductase [Planctomycetes bacterium]|nr:Ldh family oxidoreductase [Planctomycetota bacterium]